LAVQPPPSPYLFILASASPRRRELLGLLGLPFITISPGSAFNLPEVDETPLPAEAPADLVQRLSRAKATAMITHLPQLLSTLSADEGPQPVIIAADTDVAFDDQILGKPATPAQAIQMLQALRARPHDVYSGVTVARPPNFLSTEATHLVTRLHHSRVWMRPYTHAEIEAYVATSAPLDKAGAYGIQDHPFAPVERLEGCFASVMGLPLGELALALAEVGVSLPPFSAACSRYNGYPCCQSQSSGGM
jgi:septum formation protein